ncbi:MAG: M16 family metallopeptidase [Bacteroidota bacterium]|jgi:zinc protease
MNTMIRNLTLLLILVFTSSIYGFDTVELKKSGTGKIVVKAMFRTGSMHDPAGREGLSLLAASCVAEGGTRDMTSTQIADLLYPWSASIDVTVDKEVTVFTFSFHKDHADKFLPVMTGLLLRPRFDEADFSRIKSNQQNYIDQVIRTSSDEEFSKKALEALLFRGSPYQHPVAGTSEGISNSTLSDAMQQYSEQFNRNRLTLGIAGDYSDAFLSALNAALKELPDGPPAEPMAERPKRPDGIEVDIIAKPNALGSAIFAGFPMDLTRSNNDFAALMIANSWLGEHRKSYSRLYQKIREERSMNYGDYSYIEWYQNGGSNMLPRAGYPRSSNYFSIWIRPVQTAKGLRAQYPELENVELGHAYFALRMAFREMQMLIDSGMSQSEFELTRSFLRSYMKLYAQTPEQQLAYLLDSRFYGRTDWLTEADALLAACNADDVNRVIRQYWQTKQFYIAIVTDKSEADPLKNSLLGGKDSPMSYSNALQKVLGERILEEDEIVKKYPLRATSVNIIESEKIFRR